MRRSSGTDPPILSPEFRRAIYWYVTLSILVIIFGRTPPIDCVTTQLPKLPLAVSIIIPSYQREKYLLRAISSALNQSLKEIEVVVVDDQSTDSSIAIVQEAMTHDSRLRLVQHPRNAGTHAARITAVQSALGEFILSLDPDDELYPSIAEDSVHFALLHSVDIVEFQVLEVISDRAKQFAFLAPPFVKATSIEVITLFSNQRLNWNIWKRLIRRAVYLAAIEMLTPRIKTKRIIYAEDKLHIGLVFLGAQGSYFLQEPGYVYYRDNPENSESGAQQTKKECLRQLRYVERALKYFFKQKGNYTYELGHLYPKALLEEN
jgi:glycosyltransferase involved in cell wall biosynthesis